MKLRNKSAFPAEMLVGSMGEFEQMGIVVCKLTYALDSKGGMAPVDPASAWKVFREPVVVNGVTLGSELDYLKQGVDILVFGEACAPRGYSVTHMTAEVKCGALRHTVKVFGDRKWKRVGGGILGRRDTLVISEPEPFVSMPLTNDRAFGGSPRLNGQPSPHSINSVGRGYVCEEAQAEGTLLPNLELPSQLIGRWNDTPTPACFFKPAGLLLDAEGTCSMASIAEGKPDDAIRRILPRTLSQTIPALVCPEGKLGRTLELSGFDPDGPVRYPLPPEFSKPGIWGPCVRTTIGEKSSRFPLQVVTVVAFVKQRALVVTYRGLFRYLFVPEELRSAELVFVGNPALPPTAGA